MKADAGIPGDEACGIAKSHYSMMLLQLLLLLLLPIRPVVKLPVTSHVTYPTPLPPPPHPSHPHFTPSATFHFNKCCVNFDI